MAEDFPGFAPFKEDDPSDLGIGNGSQNFDDRAYRKPSLCDVYSSDDSSFDDDCPDCCGKCIPSATISRSKQRRSRRHDRGCNYRMYMRRQHNRKRCQNSTKPEAPEKKQQRNEKTQHGITRKRSRSQEYLDQSDGFVSDSGLQNCATSARKVYRPLTAPRRNITAKRSIQQREPSKHDVMLSMTLSSATASKLSKLLNPESDIRPSPLDASHSVTLKLGASLNHKQSNHWQDTGRMSFVGNLEFKLLSHPGTNARRPRDDDPEVEQLVTAMKRSKLDTPAQESEQWEKDATDEALTIARRKLNAFGKFVKRKSEGQTSSPRTLRPRHNMSKVSHCKFCGITHRSNWICPHRNRFRVFCMACGQTGHMESICRRKRPGLGMVYSFDDHAMQRINTLWLQDRQRLGQMFQIKRNILHASTIVGVDKNDELSSDESVENIGDADNSERTLLASSRLDEILRRKSAHSDTIESGAVINLLSDDENACETDMTDFVPDNQISKDSEHMLLESFHPGAIPVPASAQSSPTEIVDLSCDECVNITDNVTADSVPDKQIKNDSEHMTSWRPGIITRNKSANLASIEPNELVELDSDEFVVEINDSDDGFECIAETQSEYITRKKSTDSPRASPPRAMFSALLISTPPSEPLQHSKPAAVYSNSANGSLLPELPAQSAYSNPFLTPPNENVLDRSPSVSGQPCQRQPSLPECPLADTPL